MAIKKRKTTPKMKPTKGRQVVRSKKTVVDGIQFASGLEATMYKMLKQAGIEFSYEGTAYETFKPFELNTQCWERATRRSKQMIDRRKVTKVSYTPDFIGKDDKWFIECKGRANESFPIRWKLFKQTVSEWSNPPLIFKPTNKSDCEQVIQILKSEGYATKKS